MWDKWGFTKGWNRPLNNSRNGKKVVRPRQQRIKVRSGLKSDARSSTECYIKSKGYELSACSSTCYARSSTLPRIPLWSVLLRERH